MMKSRRKPLAFLGVGRLSGDTVRVLIEDKNAKGRLLKDCEETPKIGDQSCHRFPLEVPIGDRCCDLLGDLFGLGFVIIHRAVIEEFPTVRPF